MVSLLAFQRAIGQFAKVFVIKSILQWSSGVLLVARTMTRMVGSSDVCTMTMMMMMTVDFL